MRKEQIGYKVMQYVDNRLTSIRSQKIVYLLNNIYRPSDKIHTAGGFYVGDIPHLTNLWQHLTQKDLRADTTYAIVRCKAWGRYASHNHKQTHACFQPLEIVSLITTAAMTLIDDHNHPIIRVLPTSLSTHILIAAKQNTTTHYVARAYDPTRSPYMRHRQDGYNPMDILSWSISPHQRYAQDAHIQNQKAITLWNIMHGHTT